jgi:hypothetical protein
MKSGWVKVYRKLLDHEIFKSKDDKLLKTFLYCLLRAGHKEKEVFFNKQTVKLKAGQFITGREQASRDLGYSPKTFDRKILDLQNGTNLTRYMTRRFSIISITNWKTYQGKAEEDDPLHDPEHDPLNGTNLTTNKKKRNKEDIFVKNAIALSLASFLLEQIRRNKPDFQEPNLKVWGKDFDLMIRRDKRGPDRIKEVVSWVQADSFWYKNILSPGKLRKQFDRLELEMKGKPPSSLKSEFGKSEDHAAARRREMETAEAVPCPLDLRPGFMKEREP